MYKLGEYIDEFQKSGKRIVEIWDKGGVEDSPVLRSSGVNAWVNIMYGCDNFVHTA